MDSNNTESGVQPKVTTKTAGSGKIRAKLIWSFLVLITLTLVVIGITLVSQNYTQKTVEELVQVHGKIARLSLDTENTLRQMQGLEKDFLLQYETIGIRGAKEKYLNPFIEKGGEAYKALSQIQELSTIPQDIESAQTAIDSINEYLNAFIGTVNIIELRVDEEFGELSQLKKSLDAIGTATLGLASPEAQNGYYSLKSSLQGYLQRPTKENADLVKVAKSNFIQLTDLPALPVKIQEAMKEQIGEFDKWFTEVTNTDGIIDARITGYQEAAKKAEPVIDTFIEYAVANEELAIEKIEENNALILKIIVVVGLVSLLIAIIIAVRISRGLTNQIDEIMGLFGEIDEGNLDARAKVVSRDELGTMASKLNTMLDNLTLFVQSQDERDAIQESIMKLLEEIGALADGDFTGRAEVTEDMTGAIADSFNAMADQFSEIIAQVKKATSSVDTTSQEVASQTMALAEKNIEQVKGVTEAVDSIDEMVDLIRQVADNAQKSATVSKESMVNAQEGADAVNETNQLMTKIREQINETARSIKRLGESSLEIGNIVQIIDDIADRTSILALNASIQASMAGDAGHGFAVVADEVQRLADSSSNSTKQIELLVKSIQNEIKDVSTRIDESIGTVAEGSQKADGAHAKLQDIEDVSNQLAELVEAITESTTSQVEMSEKISQTMQAVGEISRESSLSTQDTAASMNVLNRTAQDLSTAVEVFIIEEEDMEL